MSALTAHRSFLSDILTRQSSRRQAIDPSHTFPPQPSIDLSAIKADDIQPSKKNVVNYIPDEETIRNDYAEWYGVSGEFGSNHILGAEDQEMCEEYPALRRLMDLKSAMVDACSHAPLYLPLPSPSPSDILTSLSPHRFDVILISPASSWEETGSLPIRSLSSDPGFVFLWVGSGDSDGLEKGRECFAKWGFRRAEDIVWVKTNRTTQEGGASGGGLFASQKEHCLMGIRGTVRRSTDTRFVHCNVDTDVMVWENLSDGTRFPPYLYTLIENFCLGTRRLELFGPSSSRRGWVTAGVHPHDLASSSEMFDITTYPSLLPEKSDGRDVLPFQPEVDILRPKSPQRRDRGGLPNGGPSRPRPPMQQYPSQQNFGAPGHPMMNGIQPGYGFLPQMMGFSAPQDMMNPAMAMGMGFNPQMAYFLQVQAQAQAQGINGGQPGNVGNVGAGMFGYGGMGQGSGSMGMLQPQQFGGMGGMNHMAQQGYGGMNAGQGYGGGNQNQNTMGWQGHWHE